MFKWGLFSIVVIPVVKGVWKYFGTCPPYPTSPSSGGYDCPAHSSGRKGKTSQSRNEDYIVKYRVWGRYAALESSLLGKSRVAGDAKHAEG